MTENLAVEIRARIERVNLRIQEQLLAARENAHDPDQLSHINERLYELHTMLAQHADILRDAETSDVHAKPPDGRYPGASPFDDAH